MKSNILTYRIELFKLNYNSTTTVLVQTNVIYIYIIHTYYESMYIYTYIIVNRFGSLIYNNPSCSTVIVIDYRGAESVFFSSVLSVLPH